MNVSLRTLGLVAMLTAPYFALETYFYQQTSQNTSLTGVCDLVYMMGWSCSIIGLIKLRAAGDGWGKTILLIQLAFLSIANIWNIWVIIDPLNETAFFNILDKFWPISNCFMLVTGIAVLAARQITGWMRFAPLVAGLWVPVSATAGILLEGNPAFLFIMAGYSYFGYFTLGLMIFKQGAISDNSTIEVKFN